MEFKAIFACGIILYAFTILLTAAVRMLETIEKNHE
jgi:hypothetical protein